MDSAIKFKFKTKKYFEDIARLALTFAGRIKESDAIANNKSEQGDKKDNID